MKEHRVTVTDLRLRIRERQRELKSLKRKDILCLTEADIARIRELNKEIKDIYAEISR